MKIAVTASQKSLDGDVEARFGRCQYFLIVDTDTMEVEAIENPNARAGGGAGIQSAQLLADHDVKAVLTGNCGPNAFRTLEASDIEVAIGLTGRIRDAVQGYKSGALKSAAAPNVSSHFGTRGESN